MPPIAYRTCRGRLSTPSGLLFGGDKSRHAKRDLQALSSETGEIAFFPNTLKDVDSVAAEVARDIRNQYAIAYHSPQAFTDGYHTVKVEAHASGHGKLTVYTRSGHRSKQSSSGIAAETLAAKIIPRGRASGHWDPPESPSAVSRQPPGLHKPRSCRASLRIQSS
jgi:hypothetical protein